MLQNGPLIPPELNGNKCGIKIQKSADYFTVAFRL